jgi:plastocyanin domain-containing protein
MTLNALDAAVIALGIATIAWIGWYFFLAKGPAVAADTVNGVQEVTIAVHGGYAPATVRVKAGAPIRLVFDRRETSSCSEEIVFGDFGIRKFLPAFQKTTIEIAPPPSGQYEFTCGMSMLRGTLIVE